MDFWREKGELKYNRIGLKREILVIIGNENEFSGKGGARMIKGVQKNMVWVQTPKSGYFEEAYFVVRRELSSEKQRSNEMLREANRILAEHEAGVEREKPTQKGNKERLLFFFGGMLSGSLMVALLWRRS